MKVDRKTQEKLVEIGKVVRAVRERAKISQAKLATSIGMARENIIRLEMGRANLTIETLVRVAGGLGADLHVRLVRRSAKTRR